jgi:hypothetical protein
MSLPHGEGAGNGYRYLGPNKNPLWGDYVPVGDYDPEKTRQNAIDRLARERELERQHRETSLSATARDTEIRKILQNLTLTRKHREYLEGRAIPTTVIANCRSVTQWQKIEEAHVKVPGVNRQGNGLLNGWDGIIIPAHNAKGEFTALRIHDPNAKATGNPKYAVLSGKKHGVSPHLPNGEFPVSVHYPETPLIEDGVIRLGLSEGMEFKAPAAANRLGYPVVGFSGHAQMSLSSEQIAETVAEVKARYGVERVILTILPDAGSHENESVLGSLKRAASTLSKGYPVEFGWWGQSTKEDGDIDEVADLNIKYLTTKEYFALKGKTPSLIERIQAGCRRLSEKLNRVRRKKRRLKGVLNNKDRKFTFKWTGGEAPTREELNGRTVLVAPELRSKFYEAAARSGYKYVLDISGTGTGKSHSVGEINPSACFLRQDEDDKRMYRVFYCHPNYRNPSVANIEEEFIEDASRHNGLYVNADKYTAKGEMWRHPAPAGYDGILTSGTCKYAHVFHDAYAKGHDPEGICGGCEHKSYCAKDTGDGYGFKYLKLSGQKEQKLRTCLAGLTPEMVNDKTLLVVDEAGSLEWSSIRKITLEDMSNLLVQALSHLGAEAIELNPILVALTQLVNQAKIPRFGLQHLEIIEKFGPTDKQERMLFLAEKLEYLTAQPMNELIQSQKELDNKFLSDVIRVWKGEIKGVFYTMGKAFYFAKRNERQIETVRCAGTTIFQDATSSALQMATYLGVSTDEILVCQADVPQPKNLRIKQLIGAGNFANDRSDDQINKADWLREYFKNLYSGSVGFIEYKKHSKKGDLIHFVDGRGSNQFKDKRATVSFGVPQPSLSAVHNDYQLFTGDYFYLSQENEAFANYYSQRTEAEILQEANRLRANLRPDQILDHWICTNQDLSFLEELGYSLEIKDAGTINADLLSVKERTELVYIEAAKELVRQGSAKLQDLADNLGKSLSAVSLWVKRYLARNGKAGGWKDFILLINAILGHEPTIQPTQEQSDIVDAIVPVFEESLRARTILGAETLGIFLQESLGWFGLFDNAMELLAITVSRLSSIDRGRILASLLPIF